LVVVDSWDNMETSMLKWKHIVETIMANGYFEYHHNKVGCKSGVFCLKIHDYMKGINHNEEY
jgi:hypothetical protein